MPIEYKNRSGEKRHVRGAKNSPETSKTSAGCQTCRSGRRLDRVTLNRQDVTESFQSLSKTLFVLRGHHEIAIAGAQAKCFRGFGVGDGFG